MQPETSETKSDGTTSTCDKCTQLRKSSKCERCKNCSELTHRLDFMNDELNRVCENESKLRENLDTLASDFEMAEQELSIVNARVNTKSKVLNENQEKIESLKSQLLANSADRIASLQFELERKVDELQRLGEEHRYMLSLHYSQSEFPVRTKERHTFAAEFLDIKQSETQKIDEDLKVISELKRALSENQKLIQVKDESLNKKELDLQKLTQAYANLDCQLKAYVTQFERLQGVVAEYKKREDLKFSRGLQNSDIQELDEDFPRQVKDINESEKVSKSMADEEDFFLQLEELSSRLDRSLASQPFEDAFTPKKKVSFAVDARNNESKIARLSLLEQRAKAFEIRAENLQQELNRVQQSMVEVTEAREDLRELVSVQQDRINHFLEENENLKYNLDKTMQDTLDDSSVSLTEVDEKEEELQSVIADIEVRNRTIQELAKSVNETSNVGEMSQNCSDIVSGDVSSMSSEIRQLTSRLMEISEENDLLRNEVDQARVVIDNLKEKISSNFHDTNSSEFEKSVADTTQMDYMKHENEMLNEKLILVQEKVAEGEEEIREKERQLVHLRQLLESRSERIRLVEEDLEKKEMKISSYITMIKSMKESKKEEDKSRDSKYEKEKQIFENEKLRIEQEKIKLEKELTFAKLRYEDLRSQMEDLENDFESLTNELAEIQEAKTSIETEFDKINVLNKEMASKIDRLENEMMKRDEESQKTKSMKWALETEISELKEKVEELESKLNNKEDECDNNLVDENKYLKECVDETMDRLAEADADLLKLRTNLDEASNQIMTLEKDILQKDDRIEQLQAKADEIEDLRAQVQHSEDKRQLLEKLVQEKENYVSEMGVKLQTFTENNEALQEELNTASNNVEVLQSALDSREKELELIQDEISSEKAEKESLKDQIKLLNEKLKDTHIHHAEQKTPQKMEPLLIDLSTPKTGNSRTFRVAKRILTPAKRSLKLDMPEDKVLIDVAVVENDHQMSTSTLCFDLMERSLEEGGMLQPTVPNETVVLDKYAPSQASFIQGVETVSTPNIKNSKVDVDFLRENVESKAQILLKQISGLEIECETLKSRCMKLEDSNENYQTLLQSSKDSQTVLEGRLLELIQANHDLQGKLTEKVELCSSLTRERDRLINEFGNADSVIRKLSEVEEEKRDLCRLIERLRCELNRITGLNCKINKQVNELNERLENVDCVESELEDYKLALDDVEAQNLALRAEMEEKIVKMSDEVTQAKTQFLQTNAKLLRFENMENEYEDLNSKYGQILDENERMYDEVQELRASLEKLKTIEKDFEELHEKNSLICEELNKLESLVEDQTALKLANTDLSEKCRELYEELERMKLRASKADYLSVELDTIRNQYEELLDSKNQSLEKTDLDMLDMNSKARLEQLHEDVRRAMEAKFELEVELQQALQCAKQSDNKNRRISDQLSRIVEERNDIVRRLNEVTKKLHGKEDTVPLKVLNDSVIIVECAKGASDSCT